MAIRIVPYEAQFQPAARAFNARLLAAGNLPFPIGDAPQPEGEPGPIQFRHFLAVDSEGEVRGGFYIRTQPFVIRGGVHTVGHYSAPLSEGIVDKRYAAVGPMMLAYALKRQPLVFAMGMGGMDRPLPRMLKGMGWTLLETPFFYRILNVHRFLRNAGPLRSTPTRRLAATVAAYSGIGSLAIHAAQRFRTRTPLEARRFRSERITEFGAWTENVWQANSAMFSFSAVRGSEVLRRIYPQQNPPFHGLRTAEGWVQLIDCKPRQASYFGDMKVSALVDGVAPVSVLGSLVAAAVIEARDSGADLLISNQMHQAWTGALRGNGFWQGPSNYLLALSKELAALLDPLEDSIPLIHFNRGDGDGLVNLLGGE